jgi:LysM repeat protein
MPRTRRRVAPVVAGALVLASISLAACSLGSSSATGPTSTIPSTAFKTIPVTPPKPTQPTTVPPATAATTPGANVTAAVDPAVRQIYTVQKGDCCPAQIAAKFNVPLAALYEANGMDPKKPSISVGMKLKIPRILPPTTVLPSGEKAYKVVPGDSPVGIAAKFGVSLQSLIDLNGWDPAKLAVYTGDLVKIPG